MPRVFCIWDAVRAKILARIRSAFRNNLKGTTVILIAQRISPILSGKIILLDDGAIIAEGTQHELMTSSTAYLLAKAVS